MLSSPMQRTHATVHHPRPSRDLTHYRGQLINERALPRHSLYDPNDLYGGAQPPSYESIYNQHPSVRGRAAECRRVPDGRPGYDHAEDNLPRPRMPQRHGLLIEDVRHRDANRQDTYSRLCGIIDEHAHAALQHALHSTNAARQRNKPVAVRPRSAPVDKRKKRVKFNKRKSYHEFIKGECPMRDPTEHGARRPAHRSSPPPPHSSLRPSTHRASHMNHSLLHLASAKERKSNPLARFRDRLIDLACELNYPDVSAHHNQPVHSPSRALARVY